MKRSWIGLGLLVFLLLSSLMATRAMETAHKPVSRNLQQASLHALEGEEALARQRVQSASRGWESWEFLRCCLADHTPVEEVGAGFREIEAYLAAGELPELAAACAATGEQVRAIYEAHGLNFKNLF